MDPPPIAGAATQAMEARPQDLRRAAQARRTTNRRGTSRRAHAALVAQRRDVDPPRTLNPLLRPDRSAQTCHVTSTVRTAGCGPACPVVWQGSSGAPLPPMPILVSAHMIENVICRTLCLGCGVN